MNTIVCQDKKGSGIVFSGEKRELCVLIQWTKFFIFPQRQNSDESYYTVTKVIFYKILINLLFY